MSHFSRTILYALTFLLLTGAGGFTAPSKIGVAAAVKNQVEGLHGGAPRALAPGSEVFANERIRTGDASTAQLLFLDKTALSIGPRAEIALDRFVFDPNKGTGQVVLDTVRGSFRFVTGSQNPTHYSIKTPVATLGIRGTIIDLLVQNGRTVVVLVEGAVAIRTTDGRVYDLTRPGTAFVIGANGQVQGPLPWDGTVVNVIDGVPFPLFGWTFSGDPQNFQGSPGNNVSNIDVLNAIDARGFVPPLPTTPGQGGGIKIDNNNLR